MVHKIARSALVPHSNREMFDLVNDLESYPQFMDGCVDATVLERNPESIVASLKLSRFGMTYSFTTRNLLREPHEMEMQLVEGPFQRLGGVWAFKALAPDACKVSLDLEFEFRNGLVAKAASKWFEGVANELVDGVCRRAVQIYGR